MWGKNKHLLIAFHYNVPFFAQLYILIIKIVLQNGGSTIVSPASLNSVCSRMEEQYHLSSAERAFKDKIIKRMKGYYTKRGKNALISQIFYLLMFKVIHSWSKVSSHAGVCVSVHVCAFRSHHFLTTRSHGTLCTV